MKEVTLLIHLIHVVEICCLKYDYGLSLDNNNKS